MRKQVIVGLLALGLVAFGAERGLANCGKCGGDAHGHAGEATEAKLCGHCGEVKGSDACCKEGAEICATCKLHKGSPGCKKACSAKAADKAAEGAAQE